MLGFLIDETPLRNWTLRAYQDKQRGAPSEDRELLEAVRQVLSGPRDGYDSSRYWFEDDPAQRVDAFLAQLEVARSGLARAIFTPLLKTVDDALAARKPDAPADSPLELAPNLTAHIAFHAGPIALRTARDETVICSVLSAALLVLARQGPEYLRARLPETELAQE